ncbi:MAG: DUF6152 family protein [Candidatus Rariloculaceae bacterium]
MSIRRSIVTSGFLIFVWSGTHAHHSSAPYYDSSRVIEVEGTITEVFWQNPHVLFTLQDDESEEWNIETTSVSVLSRWGLAEDVVQVGNRVRLAGSAGRLSEHAMWVTNILLPSGEEVLLSARPRWSEKTLGEDLRSEVTGDTELGIFRVWTSAHWNDGGRLWNRNYPLTESARAIRAAWDPIKDDVTADCAPKGMVSIMEAPYPIEFINQGDEILLRAEEYDLVRTISMPTEAVIEARPASLLGRSVGRWEGDTLVVDTSGISYPHFDKTGIPQTEAAIYEERFSVSADGSQLNYVAIVTDPATFTEPTELTKTWVWRPGEELRPYNCTQ